MSNPSTPAPASTQGALALVERDRAIAELIKDLKPYAEKKLGSLRIGMDEVRAIIGLHDAFTAQANDIDQVTRERDERAATITAQAADIARLEEERDEARNTERERIITALEYEASATPCSEDASVVRDCATLIRTDFSYEDAEKYDDKLELAERDLDAAKTKITGLTQARDSWRQTAERYAAETRAAEDEIERLKELAIAGQAAASDLRRATATVERLKAELAGLRKAARAVRPEGNHRGGMIVSAKAVYRLQELTAALQPTETPSLTGYDPHEMPQSHHPEFQPTETPATQSGAGEPVVKALVWDDARNAETVFQTVQRATILGAPNLVGLDYTVIGPDRHGLYEVVLGQKIITTIDSEEKAKEWAQADYERRILSALTSGDEPAQEGTR